MKTALLHAALALGLAAAAQAATFDIRDAAEFQRCVATNAQLQKLASGLQFSEGPVWLPKEQRLVFSDIPANELKVWTAQHGLSTCRKPSGHANGNTLDPLGRLVTCEHSGRRVVVEEAPGKLRVLADLFEGKKFNSPNDLAFQTNGVLWFTDPDYGGNPHEIPGNCVFRLDPKTGKLTAAIKDFDKPNGICLSPDESKLYIADSGQPRHIRMFQLGPDGRPDAGKILCRIDQGVPDGIRCDAGGRIWSSAGDGVQIFTPGGALIGKILVPESAANLCFGGPTGKTLFITAQTSLYALEVKVQGAGR